ncbi:hypothetical protein D1007_17391 [Hordeum vulgare]|nr:hypothetical protein D1007_17391 [Hordeum vulgare]
MEAGAVFRDHVGEEMACATGFLPNLLNPLHSGMLAAEAALHLASDLRMGRVYLETDALPLKEVLDGAGVDLSCLDVVVDRLKAFILCNFIECKIVHCSRTYNEVAHTLAMKGSLMVGEPNSVTDGHDPCVSALVASDLASHTA